MTIFLTILLKPVFRTLFQLKYAEELIYLYLKTGFNQLLKKIGAHNYFPICFGTALKCKKILNTQISNLLYHIIHQNSNSHQN
jgi:hypothetical protein